VYKTIKLIKWQNLKEKKDTTGDQKMVSYIQLGKSIKQKQKIQEKGEYNGRL